MKYAHHYEAPLGGITLARDGEALTGLWFDGQKIITPRMAAAYPYIALVSSLRNRRMMRFSRREM